MYKIIISPTAERDMHNIFTHITVKLMAPQSALEIYNQLLETILSLELLPERGSIRKVGLYKDKDYRQLFCNKYTIVYEIDELHQTVHIVTIKYSPSQF